MNINWQNNIHPQQGFISNILKENYSTTTQEFSPYSQGETLITTPVLTPPENLVNKNSSIFSRLTNGFVGMLVNGFNTVRYTITDVYTDFFGQNIAKGLNIPRTGINPDKATIEELLNRAADKYGVSRAVLKAIAFKESGWTMYSSNGAPVAGRNSTSTDWGIMQINDKAHPQAFPKAKTDIVYNIEYGAKYLAKQYRRYGNYYDAVAAYNAGSARKLSNGKYVNQKYVDAVFSHIAKFK